MPLIFKRVTSELLNFVLMKSFTIKININNLKLNFLLLNCTSFRRFSLSFLPSEALEFAIQIDKTMIRIVFFCAEKSYRQCHFSSFFFSRPSVIFSFSIRLWLIVTLQVTSIAFKKKQKKKNIRGLECPGRITRELCKGKTVKE